MASGVPTIARGHARDRAAAACVLVVISAGSFFFWLGIPALILWALSKATDSSAQHFVLGVIAVPPAMAAFAPLLMWLDAVYLRVTGRLPERRDRARPMPGPLGPLLVVSFLISLVGLLVWFFFFAENPPRQFI